MCKVKPQLSLQNQEKKIISAQPRYIFTAFYFSSWALLKSSAETSLHCFSSFPSDLGKSILFAGVFNYGNKLFLISSHFYFIFLRDLSY